MSEDKHIPQHIGIIMDGNGRWATKRSLPRTAGHFEGIKAAKRIVKAAKGGNIPFLTFYVFSTENWVRPKKEVDYLLNLLSTRLFSELDFYHRLGVKILLRGDMSQFSSQLKDHIDATIEATKNNSGITVTLAINYGGQDEIVRAVNKWIDATDHSKHITKEILRENFDENLIPPVDLIIRSGGEKRLSNFLLWDAAYAELSFDDTLWPDWGEKQLVAAIDEYAHRARRFGGVCNE
ncbi:MAG: di-trans,poly-cis-decaprenylcistransferase [Spirochaetia bacterium]|nr:di-trans,poly-cis-decaprenylcistransferase [Spirochaetia bacterium]